MNDPGALLSGIRVIESSVLIPGFVGTFFADLGAEVIKVEPPSGDYIRQMTWPIIQGTSLLHLHTNRGKKSIVLDLKQPAGVELYKELVGTADVVIEAMRPGSLEKLGLGYEALRQLNPSLVFATLSGYGATGPYQDLPSHGIAFDAWSGIVQPIEDELGFKRIPPQMPNVGINVGPMLAAIAVLAGVLQARTTGQGCELDLAQSDASAYLDWHRIESARLGTAGQLDTLSGEATASCGIERLRVYSARDGDVLIAVSGPEDWSRLCEALGRPDLIEGWSSIGGPGTEGIGPSDDFGIEIESSLRERMATRTVSEWLALAALHQLPMAPCNSQASLAEDTHFKARTTWLSIDEVGCEQLPLPVSINGRRRPAPGPAPTLGQHTDEVLQEHLGLDSNQLDRFRRSGVIA